MKEILETPIGNFRWNENWTTLPEPADSPGEGRTHGVVVRGNGEVLIFRQSVPSVFRLAPDGGIIGSWGEHRGAHGMTLALSPDGTETLWLTDEFECTVGQWTPEGEPLFSLSPPPAPDVPGARTIPTWVAVDEQRHGGDGSIWVADGYGASLVHRYDAEGNHLLTLDGEDGAGRFRCPHGIGFDTRDSRRELVVADRGNRRMQVFDPSGRFLRAFGDDALSSPDTFLVAGELALVPELEGRLTILDSHNRVLARIGEHPQLDTSRPGWPQITPIESGRFIAPHSCAMDATGAIYVVEWRAGGRIVRLEPV
jgi:hypothetical protein